MIEFRRIQLSDRDWIETILKKADLKGCEYTFVNNFIWEEQYHLEIAKVEGFYCSRSGLNENLEYTFPIGDGNLKLVIEKLMEDAKERNCPFVLRAMLKEHVEQLQAHYPDQFEYSTSRDDSDYIYTVEKLSALSGKRLHGKRNHIARFKDNENWNYEPIDESNIQECIDMNRKWCEKYSCFENISLSHEACAVKKSFQYYNELCLTGGLLRLNGEVVAYTIGEPLSSDTFVVHIEKAFADIQGAYPMINQQFVLNECQDFTYVNREEDMGDEGLRKAKTSYYPEILLEKYKAVLK